MFTAETHIPTRRADRYLVQLCRHFSHEGGHLRHAARGHGGADRPSHQPTTAKVICGEGEGLVEFGWGSCRMRASADTLSVRAWADGATELELIVGLVTDHLTRFSARNRLTVQWHRTEASAAEQDGDLPRRG